MKLGRLLPIRATLLSVIAAAGALPAAAQIPGSIQTTPSTGAGERSEYGRTL